MEKRIVATIHLMSNFYVNYYVDKKNCF